MRKIILLLVGFITFIACSEETLPVSENQNAVRRERANLEELYLSMINSESYIVAEEHLLSFVGKMNFDGDVSDIDTEIKMFSWISTNLTRTDFSDLLEAQAEWENVKILQYISFEKNIGFYEVIDSGMGRDFGDLILKYDPVVPQPIANSVCDDNLTLCTNSAANNYAAATIDILLADYPMEYTSSQLAVAKFHFQLSVGFCADSFVDCVLGAPQE